MRSCVAIGRIARQVAGIRAAVLILATAALGVAGAGVATASGRPARTGNPAALRFSASGPSSRSASVRPRFYPRSVTFASLRTAWALGTVRCAHRRGCLALRETTDVGRSWSARSFPAALAAAANRKIGGVPAELIDGVPLSIYFADPRDGWIYGALAVPARQAGLSYDIELTLWSTHDGGRTWRKQPPRGLGFGGEGTILDVQSAAGTVYLMESNSTGDVTVRSSPADADRWHVSSTVHLGAPAGGGLQSGAFVLQGSSGWLVEGNDRGTTGSAQLNSAGQWVSWTPPCASVGGSFAVPAASTPRDLVAVCVMGGFASQLSPSAPPGATLGSSWLYLSSDGGRTFNAGPELGPQGSFFGGVLASPSPGVILIGHTTGNREDLIASFDGGVHWTVVYRGSLLFLAFTSPSQGVGIVQSSNHTTKMIMTFDGGHRWVPVTF
jgi:hypothetical protein